MPAYDYHCEACERVVEVSHSMGDTSVRPCPLCGDAMLKRLSAPGIQFRGTGFYSTDNPRK